MDDEAGEEEEDDDDGEAGAFAAVVAAAAREGRKRLPTKGPLVTRGQFSAFVEEGLASGLVDRYEAMAAKPFNTAWRHGLAFAREGRGAVEGDEGEAAVEAAWAAAVDGTVGLTPKPEPEAEGEGEEGESEGSEDEGAGGSGPPAWRVEFHQWVLARRPVNRNTVRTYCRGVERVRGRGRVVWLGCLVDGLGRGISGGRGVEFARLCLHIAYMPVTEHTKPNKTKQQIIRKVVARLAVEKAPGSAPPFPDSTEAARRLHVEEMDTMTLMVGGVSKG